MMQKTARDSKRSSEVVSSGDRAAIVRLGSDISPATNARVIALMRALDRTPPAGLQDLVPAYASVLVLFDPLLTSPAAIEAHIRAVLSMMRVRSKARGGRLVRIPVRYGGKDGPDLEDVAQLTGLSPDDVVGRHAGAEYLVYFLGFLAGFPYLGGLPSELDVPRLHSPRSHVPAGSVGLAGQQTGIYPVITPGGWRIIGHTQMQLFDPSRNPPSLLRPGDRVHFEPICDEHVNSTGGFASPSLHTGGSPSGAAKRRNYRHTVHVSSAETIPWMIVRKPGPLATVQDLGRPGYARYGVSVSGAADTDALQLGNLLLGNPPGAAALELTLGGGEFEVLAPCIVALTGAECDIYCNGRPLQAAVATPLEAGDILQIGLARRGARTYLCVAGGLKVTPVLESCSTDVRAGLGGIEGRALRIKDVLLRGMPMRPPELLVGQRLPPDDTRRFPSNDTWVIRILPGPHAREAPHDLEALLTGTYSVDVQSDRVGVRLQTTGLSGRRGVVGGETISEGVPYGAVQVPPSGEPIILLADHQTTGGYRMPAVVAAADLWRVAQLRPGNIVHFALITTEDAVEALRARAEWLKRIRAHDGVSGEAMSSKQIKLDVAQLMRGFLEWSEEQDNDE
jgi:KipI family sensor histidine kinase inhibitor